MDKKIVFTILGAVVLSSAWGQEAKNRFYAEMKGGVLIPCDPLKKCLFVGGEIGYSYEDFRFGLELAYTKCKEKGFDDGLGHILHYENKIWTGTINVYYDYALTDTFNLYAGVGTGLFYVKPSCKEGGNPIKSIKKLGYQLMAGISYDINERWTFRAGYRYLGVKSVSFHTHGIEAGLRYSF